MTTEPEQPDGATPGVTTKLRREAFAKVCAERELTTIAAIAAFIGLSERQVDRVVNGGGDPGGRFIGRTLASWPMCSFRSLFAVVDETTGREVR